ncbi:hypothetical protein RUM44_012122 [Polyplax serrata]|uniref:Peptidase S1 domain-containing protein n=1 Tax=Polyplax serrata TaxID=468196 RepID=A0ABR1BEC2_POLSC
MNIFVTVAVLAAAALVSARPDLGVNPHVVGGTVAREGSFPFAVSLRDQFLNVAFCGGALIHKSYVLTAAHCVQTDPKEIRIGMGSVDLDKQTLVEVEKKFANPKYKPNLGFEHDIALLKLKEPVTLSRTVQLIDFMYDKNLDDKEVTAMGWGRTGEHKPASTLLLHLNKTVMSNSECKERMGPGHGTIGEGNICFSGEPNYGVCFGDSGGPLLYVDNGKKYTVGVVSWGIPCALGKPDVYVRVSHYTDWIKKIIEDN